MAITMLKVLHILRTGEFSGAENVAITIIKNYPKNIKGIYLSPNGSINRILQDREIEHYPVSKLSIGSIKRAIEEIKPDIIHAHDYTATLLAACSTNQIKVFSHLHNNVPWMKKCTPKSMLFYMIHKRIYKYLAVSESVFKESWFGDKLKKKGVVIGNPISVNDIKQRQNEYIPTQILFVGRLTDQKDPIKFLSIIKQIVNDGIPIGAIMLGKGELYDNCKDYIEEHGLQKHVQMLGFVDNPNDYMGSDGILVVPSKWEGFGLVAVEALCFGMPVVSTTVGGLTTLIDNSCGCCSNDVDILIKEIEKLLTDKHYYEEKSYGALKRAAELNNIDTYMNTISELYYSP